MAREGRDHLRQVLDEPGFRRDLQDLVLGSLLHLLQNAQFRKILTRALRERIERWAGGDFRGRIASLAAHWWEPKLQHEISALLETAPGVVDHVRVQVDRILDQMPDLLEHDRAAIESALSRSFLYLLSRLDIAQVVEHRLATISDERIESWVLDTAARELSIINLLGGLLGLAGGLTIANPGLGISFAGIFISVALFDALLARRRRSRPLRQDEKGENSS